jgi:hypothetical protein
MKHSSAPLVKQGVRMLLVLLEEEGVGCCMDQVKRW